MNATKIKGLKSYSIPWSEVCAVISEQIKDAIGKEFYVKKRSTRLIFGVLDS